ncbi:MAG: PIN domain-containing protein [Schwartzia sp.]|nr:PIN domain-containing protein [Schwartzia sp. (in: firmicutes)]
MTDFEREKVFFDTAPYIYLLDYSDTFREDAKNIFAHCISHKSRMMTSAVTVEEFCVKPYKDSDLKLVRDFKRFLSDTDTRLIPIDELIADQAAKLRAHYAGFKAMDCLQLAAAIIHDCDVFVTNDKQLKQCNMLEVMVVSERHGA